MKIIITLIALSILLTATVAGADDDNDYLGQLSANPYEPDSVSNPYGEYGNPYETDSVNNPYGDYGSPFSNKSVSNPYATDAPKLYDEDGNALYQLGTVPRYSMIGRALFVYWPAGFRLPGVKLPVVPNVGRMRLIR